MNGVLSLSLLFLFSLELLISETLYKSLKLIIKHTTNTKVFTYKAVHGRTVRTKCLNQKLLNLDQVKR